MLDAPKIDALKRKPSFKLNEEKWRALRKKRWKTGRGHSVLQQFFQFHQIKEKIDVKNADWNTFGCVLKIVQSVCLFVCWCCGSIYPFNLSTIGNFDAQQRIQSISSRGDFVKIVSTTGFRLMAKPLPLPFFTRSVMVSYALLCSALLTGDN